MPWILLWLGGIILDGLFGGRKALGQIPALETLTSASASFLQARLERKGRSRRTHLWRGLFALSLLMSAFGLIGFFLDRIAFGHTAATAIAVVLIAKLLGLKISWQHIQNAAASDNFDQRRQAIRKAVDIFSGYFLPATILFILGGFMLLLPFQCLHMAIRANDDSITTSAYLRPFATLAAPLEVVGAVFATIFLMVAMLFWPAARWTRAYGAAMRPNRPIRTWPVKLIAHAIDISLDAAGKNDKRLWLGPTGSTAKIDAAACQNALIVTLLAFALSIGFLLVLWLAAFVG